MDIFIVILLCAAVAFGWNIGKQKGRELAVIEIKNAIYNGLEHNTKFCNEHGVRGVELTLDTTGFDGWVVRPFVPFVVLHADDFSDLLHSKKQWLNREI